MADLLPVSLTDMIDEVRRELEMRARKYPEWKINASRNVRNRMDRQFDVMEAVLKHLEEEREHERTTLDRE